MNMKLYIVKLGTTERKIMKKLSESIKGKFDNASIKRFGRLVLTLNQVFPDYDFCNLRPEDFKECRFGDAVTEINRSLENIYMEDGTLFLKSFWTSLDASIKVTDEKNCQVLSYLVEPGSPPLAKSSFRWYTNYFFYNPQMLRVVFFRCYSKSSVSTGDDDDLDDQNETLRDDDDTKSGNDDDRKSGTRSPILGETMLHNSSQSEKESDTEKKNLPSSPGKSVDPSEHLSEGYSIGEYLKVDDDDLGEEDDDRIVAD